MELTFDHIIYLTGIGIGVLFTIIGIGLSEFLKNKHCIKKLTIAFKNEVLSNFNKTNFNLILLKDARLKSRQSFHLEAYNQLKLEVPIDWIHSELSGKIDKGFTFAEEYNKRVPFPEKYEEEMGSEKVILKEIHESMFFIGQKLMDSNNIIKTIKEDIKKPKKRGFSVGKKEC